MNRKKLKVEQAYLHVPTKEYRWVVSVTPPSITWRRINPSNGKLSKPVWARGPVASDWQEVEFEIAIKVRRVKPVEVENSAEKR